MFLLHHAKKGVCWDCMVFSLILVHYAVLIIFYFRVAVSTTRLACDVHAELWVVVFFYPFLVSVLEFVSMSFCIRGFVYGETVVFHSNINIYSIIYLLFSTRSL